MNHSLISSELELRRPNASEVLGFGSRFEASTAFFDLFESVEMIRAGARPVVLQFVGVGRGTDTAGVAAAYSQTASAASNTEVLYIDATGNGIWAGPDMMRAYRDGFTPRQSALPTSSDLVSWGAVGRLLALAGDDTRMLMQQVRADYSSCIVNCGALRSGSRTVPLVPMCDATVLVTDAAKTRAAEVGLARAAIERAGGRTIGAIHTRGAVGAPRWLPARH